MSFEHVEKVAQVRDQDSANERLAAGWSLLAVVPGFDNGVAYTNFVMGKTATGEQHIAIFRLPMTRLSPPSSLP